MTILGILASQYLNAPYMWGANGPFAFDCSGLVLRVMHDAGITLSDMTSQDLYDWASKEQLQQCDPNEPDCLLFYGKNDNNIKHVALSVGKGLLIEAGGAGRDSKWMSEQELALKNARVRYKKIGHRKDLIASIKLEY